MNWKRLLAYITGSVDQELLARNEYLATENRIGWHRKWIARKFDGCRSRSAVGRAATSQTIEDSVLPLARENRSWGYRRIVGALSNLGDEVSHQTVANVLKRHGLAPAPERGKRMRWRDFIRSHTEVLAAVDFFTAELLSKMILFGERAWRHCLEEYVVHFHTERNHQGKRNVILFPAPVDRIGEPSGDIRTRERLGGLLRFYHREAA